MPLVVNRSHVGVLTPLYTGINWENFNNASLQGDKYE